MSEKTFDIHYEGVPREQVVGLRGITFGDYNRSLGVRGVQKMVNRFLKCFLTPIGTDISDPDYGTPLADALISNIDRSALYSLTVQSVVLAENKIKEYDSEYEVNDEERLSVVQIDNITIDEEGNGVFIVLTLRNVAGIPVRILVPQIAE